MSKEFGREIRMYEGKVYGCEVPKYDGTPYDWRNEDVQPVRVGDQRTARCCLYEMSEKGDTLKCI